MTRTHDFFSLAKEKVSLVLEKHNISIDFNDDDTFGDFIQTINHSEFKSAELQFLYTYNSMLQTIAFSVDDVQFKMVISDYIPKK